MTSVALLPGLALGSLLIAGCVSTELVPVASNSEGAAVARTSSVEVRARVRPAQPGVPSALTPLELSIKNLAPGAISVALHDVELVTEDGRAHAILPETIRLRNSMGLGIDPASPFAATGASSSPTATASAARDISGPVSDPSETYALGAEADPRRRELLDGAFVGGPIGTGETVRGTVYFDTENIEGDRVDLRVVVRAGSDRGVAQVLEIPFDVQS